MIYVIFFQVLILLIWFNTDAFIEYFRYIPFDLFKIKAYHKAKQNDVTLSYHNYLLFYHTNFLTKLITCPICLNVWISIINCLLFTSFVYIPIVCIISLFIYYLLVKLM
jgi:hypothetical protein